MKKRWLAICLILLLAQAGLFLVALPARHSIHPVDEPARMEELLELSRSIGNCYDEAVTAALPDDDVLDAEDKSSPLLHREQLLLRLRDEEIVLRSSGTDVQLSRELEAWFRTSKGKGAPEGRATTRYLSDLVRWLNGAGGNGHPGLQRLLVQPDSASRFPALAFEGNGAPADLGQMLLAFTKASPRWRLREFDMSRDANSRSWWIRGSFIFEYSGR